MKQCSKCGESKPYSDFNTRLNRYGKEYYRSDCKDCERARKREHFRETYYPENKERIIDEVTARRKAKKPSE